MIFWDFLVLLHSQNIFTLNMKVLHLDENHPKLYQGFKQLGISNYFDFESKKIISKRQSQDMMESLLRSRIGIDKYLIEKASKLKFIVRVGSGLENIDVDYAKKGN